MSILLIDYACLADEGYKELGLFKSKDFLYNNNTEAKKKVLKEFLEESSKQLLDI